MNSCPSPRATIRQPSPRMAWTGVGGAAASPIGGIRGGELERSVVRRQRCVLARADGVTQPVDGDVLLEDLHRWIAVERPSQPARVADRRDAERWAEDPAVQQQGV